jgi:hypothetical protein
MQEKSLHHWATIELFWNGTFEYTQEIFELPPLVANALAYSAGASVKKRLNVTKQMVADITTQILDALDYIQWRGRVYLNLEPSNIIVCSGRSLGKTLQVRPNCCCFL